MKFFLRLLLFFLFALLASYVLPWYGIAVAAFVTGFVLSGRFGIFFTGFLIGAIFWSGFAWYFDQQGNYMVSEKLSALIGGVFDYPESWILYALTAVIAAFIVALGMLTGSNFRRLFLRKKRKSPYYR